MYQGAVTPAGAAFRWHPVCSSPRMQCLSVGIGTPRGARGVRDPLRALHNESPRGGELICFRKRSRCRGIRGHDAPESPVTMGRSTHRKHLHDPIATQHRHLLQMLRGHYGYFRITGKGRALSGFPYEVTHAWQKWLNRCTERGAMPWPRFEKLLERYPRPPPTVVYRAYRPYRTLVPRSLMQEIRTSGSVVAPGG